MWSRRNFQRNRQQMIFKGRVPVSKCFCHIKGKGHICVWLHKAAFDQHNFHAPWKKTIREQQQQQQKCGPLETPSLCLHPPTEVVWYAVRATSLPMSQDEIWFQLPNSKCYQRIQSVSAVPMSSKAEGHLFL